MNSALDAILRPRSVAVIGASQDPRKRGHQAVRSLIESEFEGRIYPVHPDGGELLGLRVTRSVRDIPESADLAFVCTPAHSAPALVEECAQRGIRGAAVVAAGFRESGPTGETREHKLSGIVERFGIRVIGPNTSGIVNTSLGLNLVGINGVRPGGLALLSQSGNVALDIMNDASSRGVGISVYVGVGNETDIRFHEYLEFLEHDPGTDAILMYAEGFRDARHFLETASRVNKTKPIVLLKGGRSEGGVTAARSHTGAIAGSYPVLRAALVQHGISEVLRADELLSVGLTLSTQPRVPEGDGVAILSDGGGHGALASDALAELGVPLAPLSPRTQERLRTLLGEAASVINPVDVAGAGDRNPEIFVDALDLLANDVGVNGILMVGLFGGYAVRFTADIATAEEEAAMRIAALMSEHAKPLVVHSLYASVQSPALERLSQAGVPVVGSLEVGARCAKAVHARGRFLHKRPIPLPAPSPRKAEPTCIKVARCEDRTTLMETEVRQLLEEYSVAITPATVCHTFDDVKRAVDAVGGPVALKVVSPTIPHKTEAGGVALDVRGKKKAVKAFSEVLRSAMQYTESRGHAPDVRGVLIAPMLSNPLAEMIVGIKRDPQYGPVLTIGAGGVAVEVHGDTALRSLPIGRCEAFEMLEEIRIAPLLRGFRGRPAADRDALADLILGIAECTLAHPEIEELEANPVFVYSDRSVVVDARAYLTEDKMQNAECRVQKGE